MNNIFLSVVTGTSFVFIMGAVAYAEDVDQAKALELISKYTASNHSWERSNFVTIGDLLAHYRFGGDTSIYTAIADATADPTFCNATVEGISVYATGAEANKRRFEVKATPMHLAYVSDQMERACLPVKEEIKKLREASITHFKSQNDSYLDPLRALELIENKYTTPNHSWTPSNIETLGNLLAHYRFGSVTSVYTAIADATADPTFCKATVEGISVYATGAEANKRRFEVKATPMHLANVSDQIKNACSQVKDEYEKLKLASIEYNKPVSDAKYKYCSYKDFRWDHPACLGPDDGYTTSNYEEFVLNASFKQLEHICKNGNDTIGAFAAVEVQKRFPYRQGHSCKSSSLSNILSWNYEGFED